MDPVNGFQHRSQKARDELKDAGDNLCQLAHKYLDSEEFGTLCWKLCRRKQTSEEYQDVICVLVPQVHPEINKSSGDSLQVPMDFCALSRKQE